MSTTTTRDERLERRVEDLTANDPQFAAARPDPAVAEAVQQPGLTLPQIIQEMLLTSTSERQGRVIDHDQAASMEKKKQEGYF